MAFESNFVFSAEHAPSPPEQTPDTGGSPGSTTSTTTVSFRDKVMGNAQAPPAREKVDLVAQKLVRVEHKKGNRLLPKVILDPAIFKELCAPWQDALVIKLLGKKIGYNMMKEKLKRV